MQRLIRAVGRPVFKPNDVRRFYARGRPPKKPNLSQQKPEDSIFAKIVTRQIPADIVYEDDAFIAFKDINPVAPVHVLVIPKKPVSSVSSELAHPMLLGECVVTAKKVAEKEGIAKTGYRLVINEGADGMQSVPWLHVHVIGGKRLSWPPGV
ncbi:uncharacterized HIT-like protein Synpcc7942_1390 [Schistocerca gregaria]|uniref:uncharacterized HIT-like protein Synpcc7942_1390 n=1 Tax=Schistocerca gregaria TaxID=7010 RepID=UPI00211EA168|nr:uncharacterized HIT-like protein Synpcc7942_1390 [Schistocerca gregaria]